MEIPTGLVEANAAPLGKAAVTKAGTGRSQQDKDLGVHFTPWEVHGQREPLGQPGPL